MTCAACRSTGCTHSDPVYAGICPSPPAAFIPLGSRTSTGGGALPVAAGDIVDQRAGDREADGTWRGVEGVPVHTPAYDHSGGATSSGKADDISGEVLA